jgi:hypothetical protein
MNRGWKGLMVLAGALCCGVIACSNEKKAEPVADAPKPGAIEQFTDKTAAQVEQKIRSPIDKARATQGQGEERLEAIDEAMKKQRQ